MTTNREAQLLEASRYATPAEQRRIQAELSNIRRNATATVEQDRELDLTASLEAQRKPVFVHSMHTASTDWLDDIAPDFTSADMGRVARDVKVAAESWFRSVNPVVRQERTEFGEQLRGVAAREASQYGTLAAQARQVFTSHVASLYRLAEGTDMADTPSAAGDTPGSNPDLVAWDTEDDTGAGAAPDYENPPGIDSFPQQVGDDGGSGESNPTDSSPTSAPAVDKDDTLDVTDSNNAAGSTQAEVAQDTTTASYHGSLIAQRARHFLAVEEGQPFPVPGESDPEQSGEAGTSLPRSVEPTDAPETLDNFIDFNKDDPAAVSSDRAKNISANSARHTAGDQPPWLQDDDKGDDDAKGQTDDQDDEAKEASRRFANWVGAADPFAGSPARQGRTAGSRRTAVTESNDHCEYELDGTDTDGTKWYHCKTHDALAPSPDAPCEGYRAPAYQGSRHIAFDGPAKCGKSEEHGAHMYDGNKFCVGNKGDRIVEQTEKTAVATGPNPQGSTIYSAQAAEDQGYKEGYKYALTYSAGKPIPAAVSSSADIGEKYNSQYVTGYRAGLTDGIASMPVATQAAWSQAASNAIQVAAAAKTARDFDQAERDKDAKSGDAESDGSFPIENASDLANAKADLGRAGDKPSDVAHVNERAKALGEPGVGESKESKMAALPQLELADMDDTPSNPTTWSGADSPTVDGKGAADVANVATPGAATADYPQPGVGGAPGPQTPDPAIGDDPADAWVGADAPADSEKTAAFRRTVQASLRG